MSTARKPGSDLVLQCHDSAGFLPGLQRLSWRLARIEQVLAGVLVGLVFLLLVLNIVTRLTGKALYWVDEAAIMAMVWMAFLAASVSLHARANIAVTLLRDALPPRLSAVLGVVVDVALAAFVVALLWMLWRWFEPLSLWQVGFDTGALAAQYFNFIYQEPTQTLGLSKFWLWLILPAFGLGALVHALANLDLSVARLWRGEEG